jgi:tetratricopeptide (TPR) repeat protein
MSQRFRPNLRRRLATAFGLVALGWIVAAGNAAAQTDEVVDSLDYQSGFQAGVEAYAQDSFKQAAFFWQEVADAGHRSAALFYNLGNAYFRLGKWALAALYYERAQRLAPNDDDIAHNLQRLRDKLPDAFEAFPADPLEKLFRSGLRLLPPRGWAGFGIVSLWLSLLGASLYLMASRLHLRQTGKYVAGAGLGLALLGTTPAFIARSHQQRTDEAVIMAESVNVKSSPAQNGTDVFILHEGTKVELEGKVRNWVRIRLPDQRVGWIKAANMAVI